MDALAEEGRAAEAANAPAYDLGGGGAEERYWVVNLDTLCQTTAATWCQSFGSASDHPVQRLSRRILAGFAAAPHEDVAGGDIQDLLHRIAHEAIRQWFAGCGFDVSGRSFDRLRHSFVMANRDGRLADQFLDPEIDRERMRIALSASAVAATPTAIFRSMPRQTL